MLARQHGVAGSDSREDLQRVDTLLRGEDLSGWSMGSSATSYSLTVPLCKE